MKKIKPERPFFCYDKTAKILLSRFSQKEYERGFSGFCYGKMKKAKSFKEKEAEHVNDICHCYYTPLKGAIRYFVCAGDLWEEINAKIIVLNKVQPVGKCYKCRKEIYRDIRVCIVDNKRRKKCYDCKESGK